MRIFILEDDNHRIDIFKNLLNGNYIVTSDNAHEAINTLLCNEFDLIFLDHDLGGNHYASSDENSGYQVADFIKKHNIKTPVVIHSLNPVGAERMYKTVPCGFRIPFSGIIDNPLFWEVLHAIQMNLMKNSE